MASRHSSFTPFNHTSPSFNSYFMPEEGYSYHQSVKVKKEIVVSENNLYDEEGDASDANGQNIEKDENTKEKKSHRSAKEKQRHNAVERKRKQGIKSELSNLSEAVPNKGHKQTQWSILHSAVTYINELKDSIERLQHQNAEIRNQQNLLLSSINVVISSSNSLCPSPPGATTSPSLQRVVRPDASQSQNQNQTSVPEDFPIFARRTPSLFQASTMYENNIAENEPMDNGFGDEDSNFVIDNNISQLDYTQWFDPSHQFIDYTSTGTSN